MKGENHLSIDNRRRHWVSVGDSMNVDLPGLWADAKGLGLLRFVQLRTHAFLMITIFGCDFCEI
jgi:hypothetical protein